jgi:hypothetical protein
MVNKIIVLLSNHTNNKLKYNICLNNIELLNKYFDTIEIIDSSDEYYATQLNNDLEGIDIHFHMTKHDNYLYFGKWMYGLSKINWKDYDAVLFINDSILLLDEVQDYFLYIVNNLENNIYAYNDCYQMKYHYQTHLFVIKKNCIDRFIDFFEKRKGIIYDLKTFIETIELELINIDENKDVFLKIGSKYNLYKNANDNDELFHYLLYRNLIGLIKLNKLYNLQKDYKITLYGENIPDFDYDFYRSYYDFYALTDEELLDHFIKIGQFEGYRYQNKIEYILPDYYRTQLKKRSVLYFFDIPNDFDIYYYKKNANSNNGSIINAIFNYIEFGIYEGKLYNKTEHNNTYLNNYYTNILKSIKKNIDKLPYDFNLYSSLLLNNFLDHSYYFGIVKNYLLYNQTKMLYQKNILDEILLLFDENSYKKLIRLGDNYDYLHTLQNFISKIIDKKGNILKLPYDFDLYNYKKIYKDLSHLKDKELKIHYLIHGMNEKRIYKLPDDFNAKIYKSIYKDLANISDNMLEEHYLTNGVVEKRIYSIPEDFDPSIYKNIYRDIAKLSDVKLKEHYTNYGKNQGRIYKLPEDFNPIIYKTLYDDLMYMEDVELMNHYLFHGIMENRIYKLPDDFNCKIYKKIYNDLVDLSDEELKIHYIQNGFKEKRIYKIHDDFNPKEYRDIYPLLEKLNDEETINYYLYKGLKKKKYYKLHDDFSISFYKYIYNDVKHMSDYEIKKHYLTIGRKEKRYYNKIGDFNYDLYKRIYSDLEKMDNNELMKHYILHGIKENRIYKIPDDFNYEVYRQLHEDLRGFNEEELKNHYLFHGVIEKRRYV